MKRNQLSLLTITIVLASAFMSACSSTSPLIQVSAIKKPAMMIIERHDQYVVADVSLTPENITKYLSESFALKGLLLTKLEAQQSSIEPLAVPVCNRHDEYVIGDGSLDDLHSRTYLRSSKILLQVIAAGK